MDQLPTLQNYSAQVEFVCLCFCMSLSFMHEQEGREFPSQLQYLHKFKYTHYTVKSVIFVSLNCSQSSLVVSLSGLVIISGGKSPFKY